MATVKTITQEFSDRDLFIKEGLNIANNGRGFSFKINSLLETIRLEIRHGECYVNGDADRDSISSAEDKLKFNLGFFFDKGFNEIVYIDFK